MAFIPAINTARAQMIYTYNGQKVENVLHFTKGAPFTVGDQETLALALWNWWDAQMKGWFNIANSLDHIEVQALDFENSPGIVYTTDCPVAGTEALADNMPGNVTLAVTLNTAFRGRSFRGRIYHVGMLDAWCTGNVITGAVAILMKAKYDILVAGIGPGSVFKLAVVSYQYHKAPRVTAEVTEVTSCYIHTQIDSQRRRLYGRGQ